MSDRLYSILEYFTKNTTAIGKYTLLVLALIIPVFIAIIEILVMLIPGFPLWTIGIIKYNIIIVSFFLMALYLLADTNDNLPLYRSGKTNTIIRFRSLFFLGVYVIMCVECFFIEHYTDYGFTGLIQ